MKDINITKQVMKNVTSYERSGISKFFLFFISSIVSLLLSSIVGFVLIIHDLLAKRAFDLFELFTQDSEIIRDFWQDALITFWDEIPANLVFIVIMLLLLLAAVLVFTRKKRYKIKNKLQHLDKYS
jgi:hypothetical protein